jgi:hypothetical protein
VLSSSHMLAARSLIAVFLAAPILAAPRAVVFGIWGNVPGAPVEEMTAAWREAAAKVPGFQWVALTKTLAEIRATPGCAKLGPECRTAIANSIGADVLFVARHFPWGGAFEQVDVATGNTVRKAKMPFEVEGAALVAASGDAGVKFVQGGAPKDAAPVAATPVPTVPPTPPPPAAAKPVPPVPIPAPGPAAVASGRPAPAPAAPAPTPPPIAEAPAAEVPAAEAPATEPRPVPQVIDSELHTAPRPRAVGTEVEVSRPSGHVWSKIRLRTWITAGAAVTLLASGAVMGARAFAAADDLNDANRGCATTQQLPTCVDLQRTAHNRALAANILLAVGGAAAAGTGVLLYLDLTADQPRAGVAMKF